MTFGELLDSIAFDAADTDGAYRTRALTWLNLARSHASNFAMWRSAIDPDVELTTAAATTDGLYSITGGYDQISGSFLYDETNENTIRHESFATLNAVDQAKETVAEPDWWADAGHDSNGDPQIYLWPVPDGTYTIRLAAYKTVTDITDEDLAVDPYFGPLAPWAPAIMAGIRYYADLNNNETPQQSVAQLQVFERMVKLRARKNGANTGTLKLKNVRSIASSSTGMGRFNPSHYNNRG
jgi:hypothetical protein